MTTPQLSERLRRYVQVCAGESVALRLERLAAEGIHDGQDMERVLTALVLVAGGDAAQLDEAVALARADWRDLLVAAGLADENWPERLTRMLGR